VTGAEFIRRVRRLGRKRGVEVRHDARRGKGDHGMPHHGGRRIIVGGLGELPKRTFRAAMPRQLGVTTADFEE
jgi:mRNA interferase HicA